MKKLRSMITLIIISAAWATPVFAAGAREDNSSLLVWAFLSLCALIVLVQLLPVIFMAFGIVSGAIKAKRPEAKAVNK